MKDSTVSNDALLAEVHTLRVKLDQLEREAAARREGRSDENKVLLDVIRQVQAEFIAEVDTQTLFDRLLHHLLSITQSEYGFIGEILHTIDGAPYLKAHAITNIAWNAETRRFYEENAPGGLEFHNLETLFGAVITTGEPVFANTPLTDPRRGGLPEGHPALDAFLGLPLHTGASLIGMVGLANRAEGYDACLVAYLEPLLATCANIISAHRSKREREQVEEERRQLNVELEQRVHVRTVALEVANRKLHTVVSNAPVILYALDREGRFTVSEGKGLAHLGLEPGQVVGLSAFDVYRDNPVIVSHLRRVLAGEECTWTAQVGDFVYDSRALPLFDEQGHVTGCIGIATDITPQKQAEQARLQVERRYHQLVELAQEGIWVIDEDSNTSFVNMSMARMLGYTPEEMQGRHLFSFMDEQGEALATHKLEQREQGISEQHEFEFLRKDGKRIYTLIETAPITDEADIYQGAVAGVIDITVRKRTEKEREALIGELEMKNHELERFAYTVSHDLKSPLVTIKCYLGLLQQDVAQGDAKGIERDFGFISNAAEKMERLLHDVLELSRIGRRTNPSEAISLTDLAGEAARLVAGRLNECGIAVEIAPAMPVVFGDRVRLLEVYQNLMDNAAKFMGDQAEPRIEVGTGQDGEQVVCYVRDNGMGINAAYQEKVFDLFERLDTSTDGTGIGLAVVKRIVGVHGGRIWVESKGEGQGATFYFTLPTEESTSATL